MSVDALELPQLKCKTEQEAIDWWVEKTKRFPNLSAMARQYLGCPATSATVERLFSRVGIAFSAKRKSSDPATVADLMFANANLPYLCIAPCKKYRFRHASGAARAASENFAL